MHPSPRPPGLFAAATILTLALVCGCTTGSADPETGKEHTELGMIGTFEVTES